VIYLIATVCLARSTPTSRRVGIVCCSVELVGVLLVGAASLVWRSAFPDATVWSGFGAGYGFFPVLLPVVGLWWLRRGSRAQRIESPPPRVITAASSVGPAGADPA
jgi:hypothetical protein